MSGTGGNFARERQDVMNQLLNKMERRFGRFAVPDLIKYVVGIYCAGAMLGLVDSVSNLNIYYNYLALDIGKVAHGQVWRLFTFLIEPYGFSSGLGFIIGIIFFLFQVNLFFLFGRSLEQAWGTFRFNMYILSGWLLNIIAAIILYVCPLHSTTYNSGMQYIYWSMFFAFALLNPEMKFLLYGILPIKVKWLAILDAVYMLYQIFNYTRNGIYYLRMGFTSYSGIYFSAGIAIVVAMANFLVYFLVSRGRHVNRVYGGTRGSFRGGSFRGGSFRGGNRSGSFRRVNPQQNRTRRQFNRNTQGRQNNTYANGARHRCAICGRTELDDYRLDFRYCSKCDGNYEYCSDHLFTHQHVKKFM